MVVLWKWAVSYERSTHVCAVNSTTVFFRLGQFSYEIRYLTFAVACALSKNVHTQFYQPPSTWWSLRVSLARIFERNVIEFAPRKALILIT